MELMETTTETSRMIPLRRLLRTVWTLSVSVNRRCISNVQTFPSASIETNVSVSSAPVTARRFASSSTHRTISTRTPSTGTGTQSRSA